MVQEKLKEIVLETVNTLGLTLIESQYVPGKKQATLRVVIFDSKQDVSTGNCQKVARALSDRLDEDDILIGSYNLIVESPGVDREFKNPEEYTIFIGKEVKLIIKDFARYDLSDNTVIGILVAFDGKIVTIMQKTDKIDFELKDISKGCLYFDIKKYL